MLLAHLLGQQEAMRLDDTTASELKRGLENGDLERDQGTHLASH